MYIFLVFALANCFLSRDVSVVCYTGLDVMTTASAFRVFFVDLLFLSKTGPYSMHIYASIMLCGDRWLLTCCSEESSVNETTSGWVKVYNYLHFPFLQLRGSNSQTYLNICLRMLCLKTTTVMSYDMSLVNSQILPYICCKIHRSQYGMRVVP